MMRRRMTSLAALAALALASAPSLACAPFPNVVPFSPNVFEAPMFPRARGGSHKQKARKAGKGRA